MSLPMSFALRRWAAALALAAGLAVTLSPGAARAVEIQRVISPGGIEAWLVEEHTVPLIAVNFAFDGGNAQDLPGKEGTANFLTTMLDEGAGDLDSEAFQDKVESLSMRLSFQDGRDSFYGEMKTLAENRDDAFGLLALALTKPRFADDSVDRMRRELISSVRRSLKDPDSVGANLWSKTVFPDHPYGHPSDGTEQTLTAIGAADLRDYHARIFARDHLKIGVVGAIDAKTLAGLLDTTFGALPAKARLSPVADVVPVSGAVAHSTMAVAQAAIRFSTPGLKRADPDFIAAFVMNHILGGGSFSSWLYDEVREKRGLAYSISTSLVPFDHAGLLIGGVGTRPDRVAETLSLVREQFKRMAEDGPTEAELAKAKDFIMGSYALRFDTSDKIAGQLVAIQQDDLGIDYIEKRNGLVAAVTLADVKRLAKQLLSTPLTVITVGPDVAN